MAGIAHDVGILVDQEDVLELDAGLRVDVVGAVPLRAGGEDRISVGDVVDVKQLALALDDVQRMLGKAGGNGVAVGVGQVPKRPSPPFSLMADSTLARILA